MRGEDAGWDAVPVSRDGQRSMPHPRGPEHRGEDGGGQGANQRGASEIGLLHERGKREAAAAG